MYSSHFYFFKFNSCNTTLVYKRLLSIFPFMSPFPNIFDRQEGGPPPLRTHTPMVWFWFCCSGRIPRLSLNQHSLYVRVVEKFPPPPLTGEQYGKMEPKYHEGGHCQNVLRPQGVLTSPFILNNSVETAAHTM